MSPDGAVVRIKSENSTEEHWPNTAATALALDPEGASLLKLLEIHPRSNWDCSQGSLTDKHDLAKVSDVPGTTSQPFSRVRERKMQLSRASYQRRI